MFMRHLIIRQYHIPLTDLEEAASDRDECERSICKSSLERYSLASAQMENVGPVETTASTRRSGGGA